MNMVLENNKVQLNQRPAYTRYELAKLVKDKRNSEYKTREQFAAQYGISVTLLNNIENASRAFNVPMYRACSIILNKSIEELTATVVDKEEHDYRANQLSTEVTTTVDFANMIFSEIVMQHKLSVR